MGIERLGIFREKENHQAINMMLGGDFLVKYNVFY